MVVAPPPTVVVYAVPTATTVVYVGTTPYYYYGGTYYVVTTAPAQRPPPEASSEQAGSEEAPTMTDGDENYEVVGAPIGATVPYLPEEAEEQRINGRKYFVFDATYYQPFSSEGETIYMVVERPA